MIIFRMYVLLHIFSHVNVLESVDSLRTWERTYQPDWKQMDIKYWAENINKESNIMVKSLVGKPWSQEATEDDLTLAIGTLKSKFVIGLMNQMEESIHRFNVILGIDENEEVKKRCMRGYFGHGVKKKNSHSHPKVSIHRVFELRF